MRSPHHCIESSLCLPQQEKSPHSNEDLAQPKINNSKKIIEGSSDKVLSVKVRFQMTRLGTADLVG